VRRAARTDATHAAIVDAFERMGCTVLDLSRVGNGCPDLLVAAAGRMVLIEVKDGGKTASRRKLTPAQVRFTASWPGQWRIVERVDQVPGIVRAMRWED